MTNLTKKRLHPARGDLVTALHRHHNPGSGEAARLVLSLAEVTR